MTFMKYELHSPISDKDHAGLNKYSDILAQVLHNRGQINNDLADDFLDISYEKDTHDPFLLKDIDVAVDRILRAIRDGEKICVFSDYDADGIPGAVVLSDFLRKAGVIEDDGVSNEGENFFVYIPHRNKEGFGLNNNAVDAIAERGAKLLITIDCGITDTDQIARATDAGIDVIVTDHHDPNGHVENSRAIATVNPKREDCNYPDKNLCGAGVIFKVVQALVRRGNEIIGTDDQVWTEEDRIPDGWEKWLLDMVGIATLSDMVPLVGENRVFAHYGMIVMRKSPRKGFQKLLRKTRTTQRTINEEDVGFSITPRINAASRMGEPEVAYQMLSTNDDSIADETVQHLDKINNERKGKVAAMVREIHKTIDRDAPDPVIVKGNPNWIPSLLGLACSKIVEEYGKPVFLWGRGEGHDLKGSCRSDGSVALVSLMNRVRENAPDVIAEFGGHTMAGGFVVSDSGIHDLQAELNKAFEEIQSAPNSDSDSDAKAGTDTESAGEIEVPVDAKLKIDDVSWDNFNEIEKLSPFGMGNERPLFMFEGVKIEKVEMFGKAKEHLKLTFAKEGQTSPKIVQAIKFFASDSDKFKELKDGQVINLVANMEKSTFGRYPELRLRVVDLL
jgi:single-stranded-DNA-specific exonuclease